ncbi:MAG: hypothetical protein ABFD82_13505 [Syntrophaceae bacterium]
MGTDYFVQQARDYIPGILGAYKAIGSIGLTRARASLRAVNVGEMLAIAND